MCGARRDSCFCVYVYQLHVVADKLVTAAIAAQKAKAAAKATGATEAVDDTADDEFGHIDDDVKSILVVRGGDGAGGGLGVG